VALAIEKTKWDKRNILLLLVNIVPLAVLILSTNPESWTQFTILLGRKQFGTLLPFMAIWGFAIIAILVAAFHTKIWVRIFWGTLIAASTAATWGYYQVSGSQLNVLDMMSLWNERHEANRATEFYGHQMLLAAGMFALWLVLFAMPTPTFGVRLRKWISWASLVPVLPIAMIATVFWFKNGATYIPMPSQFNSLSLASLLAIKVTTRESQERQSVSWQPLTPTGSSKPNNIIYLVDESLRGDYIDLTPGNVFTPKFAALADKFVNFGPAVSGGNCSNYSNALLRFGVSRKDIVASANTNATLFEYAKRAGFRTVFIDAQARNITDGNFLQNFMTMKEKSDIDAFYAIRDLPSYATDEELARIVAVELKSEKPVFIYANKNGAHFPYDDSYPASDSLNHPTMTESDRDTQAARVASYHNAISWSVDRFMAGLFAQADLSATTMIYTSDHGQRLQPAQLTHCQVENPDPRMGLVPLMVYTSDPAIRAKFEKGVALSRGKASHFQIAPTLYNLMGYAPADIAKSYDESLFDGTSRPPEMTTGDIFGVFSKHVNVTPVDLSKSYMEPDAINNVVADKPVLPPEG
jgi:glucan phosphoethanolaminetransferase (alkaline phosphatase superfamily)